MSWPERTRAFGQLRGPSTLDRLGVWLSSLKLRAHLGPLDGLRLGDFGCGYEARFVRSVLGQLDHAVLVDVGLAADLCAHPKVTAIEGRLPEALAQVPSGSLDAALCVSVLEHLWDPLATLLELRRLLRPGGRCLINVPSWRGKWALELSAFTLGLSPREEMNDHKRYYDPKDLWPLLVRAGFLPEEVRVSRHKLGLNTFAICRAVDRPEGTRPDAR
jgi:SAM-dependent methyltransferase